MSVQNQGAGAEGAKESRPSHFEERFTAISEWRGCGATGCGRGAAGEGSPPFPQHSQGHPPSRTAVSRCLPSWLLTCLSHASDHRAFLSQPWAELRNCLGKEGSREEKRDNPPTKLQTPAPNPEAATFWSETPAELPGLGAHEGQVC